MSQKVEIEIGIKDRFSKDYSDIHERIGKTGAVLDDLKQKATELIGQFSQSVKGANLLSEELKQMAASGASFDELISKAEALEDAETSAMDAGAAAVSAQTQYVKALQTVYGETSAEAKEAASTNMELFQRVEDVGQRAEQTSQKLSEYKEKIEELSDKTEKASRSSKGLADDISKVPGPLGDAARGTKALTKETLVFLATPLGMTLAAISAGLALVSSWFHRTEEGEEAMNVATARFTGTLNTLLDVADNVGEWLYKAFTSPREAINELWHSLKDKVLADMKRVAEMGAGIVKIFKGDIGVGFAQVASAWEGIGFGGLKQRARENGDKQADIARRQNALDRQQRDWIVERERKEARISELRAKIYDSTVKESEKAKAIKEAKKLTNELYDKEVSMAKEQHAIIADTNSLSHSSIADKKKEQEALAKTISLERQRNDSLRMLNRNEGSLSNKAASAAKKDRKESEEDAQRRQKLFELKQKELEDQAAQEMATRESVNAARIASIRSDAERQRAEEDEQYRLDMEAIDRRSEEMRKKRYEAMKAEWEAQNKDKTKIWADTKEAKDVAENGYGSVQLSQAEEEQLAADRRKREEEYKRLIEQRYREEAQALLDYLKEYGSVEEKKYAIAKEYDERISKERDANRKKYLEAEKQKQLDAIDVEILRTEIDWTTMFDGIGSALEDEMKATLEKIEKYMQTDAFKRLDAKDKREFVNMRNDLSQKTGSGVGAFDFSVYGKIADELKAYQEAMHTHKQAVIAHTAAVNKLKEADKEVEEAKEQLKKAVTEEETLIAKKNLTEKTLQQKVARGNVTATGQFVNQAKGEVVVTQGNVTRTVSEAEKAINNFGSALNQMSNGTLKGFADGLVNLVNSISGGDTKGLSGLGKAGGIVGAILSIIDALGDDPAKFVDQLFDKVANVLEAVISQLPQIIMSIVKGAGNIVASLGKGILGAFGIGQDNHQEQVRYQEKLTKSINSTTKALDKMTEQLEKSYGIMAIQNQKSAEELIRKNMEAIMNGIDSVLSDNYGGGNSDYYHLNKNQSVLAQIQSYGSMFGVNAKEGGKYTWQQLLRNNSDDVAQLFKYIQEHDAELWRQITQESGYNDGALEEWIQKLIDTYDQIAENDKQLKEQLTTTSEENVYDDFLESLYNLADGSEDVTEDIAENRQKMVNRMAVNNLVAENFREKLKLWYEDLADLNQRLAEGMDPDEYNAGLQALQDRYNKMVSDATGDIERLSQIGVIKAIEKAEEEVKGYAETVRSAFQELLSGTVDDVEQWAKDIRKAIAQDIMEGLLLDEEFDKWSKDWSQRYADLLKAKNTGKVDDQSYKGQLNALLDEFDDMTGALSEKGRQMMEDFGEEMAADTSFKDMTDSWISSLMDFEATAEDWAENLGRMMAQKIIKELVAPTLLQPYLDALQKAMNDALSAEGATWESVLSNGTVLSALDDIKKAYPELQKVIQDVMSALGITPDTEAAKDAFADLSGTIVSSLMDTEKTAEDFGKEIGRKLVEQMLAQMVNKKFAERIKDIQKIWEDVLAGKSEYTLEDVKRMIVELRDDVQRETKALTDTIRDVVSRETPFDGLRSSMVSVLSDMEGDIDSFCDNLNKKIINALIDEFVLGDAFNDWLDGLKKDYSKILSDKTLSPVERTKALQGLTEIVKDQTRQYQEQAKMIHELWGTNTVKDQSAYMNTAEKSTYDQADIIAGMTTSLVMGQQQGNEVRELILQALKAMSGITGSGTNYGEQIYNRLGTTNDYLLIIKEQVKNYLGPMNDKLSTILSKL